MLPRRLKMKKLILRTLHLLFATTFVYTIDVQPTASDADCICPFEVDICSCTLYVEYKLTMILEKEKSLVFPSNGVLRMLGKGNNSAELTPEQTERVITADGQTSRLVITINGKFPGPRIEVWENQVLNITVYNTLHTDSVTVHFHGIYQKGTPWMDGVAFVTQCPILPGQRWVYSFSAYPVGTFFYHAHIGDQRSMGLYGPLIVRSNRQPVLDENEIIIALQDWNHLMDAETAYARMITEQFDFESKEVINTTYSVDLGKFSRFEFHSGLANGKGRFWTTNSTNNGSPLERFKIKSGEMYRFRVIGAMTLYPMRVYIYGHRLTLRSSDAFDLEHIAVQSIIVHPGERYDFYWQAPAASEVSSKHILLIAETIETPESLSFSKYHAAEVVLEMKDFVGPDPPSNPVNVRHETCTNVSMCPIFNCPYQFYLKSDNRKCITFNDIVNTDANQKYKDVLGNKVDEEYFFNFAFPGPNGNTPGSINGREFIFPTAPLLTQPSELSTKCTDVCNTDGVCRCTHIQKIPTNKLIQIVFTNLGKGSGWSHPIHLHGHSVYIMKMGFGKYNKTTGVLLRNSDDIICLDRYGYCSNEGWNNISWADGNVPNLNSKPPMKDTFVVPTGGYVVARFRSDNPGTWFLHCHIDLHNTNGMAMVIDVGESKPTPPGDFPTCRDFLNKGNPLSQIQTNGSIIGEAIGVSLVVGIVLGIVGASVFISRRNKDSEAIPLLTAEVKSIPNV